MTEEDVCPKGGEHQWKFNGGNPVCLKCDEYKPGHGMVVLPATMHEDGTVTVHVPGNEVIKRCDCGRAIVHRFTSYCCQRCPQSHTEFCDEGTEIHGIAPHFTVVDVFEIRGRGPVITRGDLAGRAARDAGELFSPGDRVRCGELEAVVAGIESFAIHNAPQQGLLLNGVTQEQLKPGQVWIKDA